jgi:hypothetical protein
MRKYEKHNYKKIMKKNEEIMIKNKMMKNNGKEMKKL